MPTPVTVTFDLESNEIFARLGAISTLFNGVPGVSNVNIEVDTTTVKPFAFASAFTSVVQTVADMAGISPDDIKNFVRPPA